MTTKQAMSDVDMADALTKRALGALHNAACRIRFFSQRPLNDAGRAHLFFVADAAHNIPLALSRDPYHRDRLAEYLKELEDLLVEPYGVALAKYVSRENSSGRPGLARTIGQYLRKLLKKA